MGSSDRPFRAGAGPAVLFALLVTTSPANGQDPPTSATIAQLAWLAGAWTGDEGATRYEEHWTAPAGGAMLATARTLRGERMVTFEFLRVEERDGGLVYLAQPEGRPPTAFVLTRIEQTSVTFENREHDFPKAIRYRLLPDGSLEARIGDGGREDQSFLFRRQAAGAPDGG